MKHLYNHCKREHPDNPDVWPSEPIRLGPIRTLHERLNNSGESGDKFQCGLEGCSLLFDRFLSLVDHERTGHPSSYLCILCGLACYSADSLVFHSDNNHANKSAFICRVCGFFNRNARGLTIHTQQEHMKGTVTYQVGGVISIVMFFLLFKHYLFDCSRFRCRIFDPMLSFFPCNFFFFFFCLY